MSGDQHGSESIKVEGFSSRVFPSTAVEYSALCFRLFAYSRDKKKVDLETIRPGHSPFGFSWALGPRGGAQGMFALMATNASGFVPLTEINRYPCGPRQPGCPQRCLNVAWGTSTFTRSANHQAIFKKKKNLLGSPRLPFRAMSTRALDHAPRAEIAMTSTSTSRPTSQRLLSVYTCTPSRPFLSCGFQSALFDTSNCFFANRGRDRKSVV